MRNVIVLFSLAIILSGCGPFLIVNQPQPAPVGSLYIVRNAVFTPDTSFFDAMSKVGFRIVKNPQQADYTLFVGSALGKISIMFFNQKDNICLLDRIYTPAVGNPAIVIAHDMRHATSAEPPIIHSNKRQNKCKI